MNAPAPSPPFPADAAHLREGASLGLELSKELCHPSCASYHGIWVMSRLFGVLAAVARDHDALLRMIEAAAHRGLERVLVSGAADFGITAYVIEGYRRAGRLPRITVVDRCRTPLALNRWYGERRGVAVGTVCSDFLAMPPVSRDLIVAHSFLNFFAPADHVRVMNKWVASLAVGGELILAGSVRPGAPERARRFGGERENLLVDRMLSARKAMKLEALSGEAQLEAMTRDYARRRKSWNIQSPETLMSYFDREDLEIVEVVKSALPAGYLQSDRPSRRYLVVARKR